MKNQDQRAIIETWKNKTDDEILAHLAKLWRTQFNDKGFFTLVGTYQKSDTKDKQGKDFARFVDIRNDEGDILYYPYGLGKVHLWTSCNSKWDGSNNMWKINVKLSDKKYRNTNPFHLSLANAAVGVPSINYKNKLDKEVSIRKIFNETGYTERDAKNTVNSLHNIMDDLYTDADDRFVFELLQNADDQAEQGKPVAVSLKLLREHLLFMHDGRAFDVDDVNSICSIGDSTKRKDKEKIGYKGIGFKSVFAGSDNVIIHSGNFSFAFDKHAPVYENKNIEHIPWQLKPIWQDRDRYPREIQNDEFFWEAKVGISLEVKRDRLNSYQQSIESILSQPIFLLFLRNVSSIRFQNIHIAKQTTKNGILQIKKNETIDSRWTIKDYVVDIPSNIRERIQNDKNVPQKLKDSTKTKISFAAQLDEKDNVIPAKDAVLYAYLPISVSEFKFSFIVNADFLLVASREQLHNELWNEFLFTQIGKLLLDWVATLSTRKGDYLKLLPTQKLNEQLVLSIPFNKAFLDTLEDTAFILNQSGKLATQKEIILDHTGLSKIVGASLFCQIMNTSKRLPSDSIDSSTLNESIYEQIEKVGIEDIADHLIDNKKLNDWYIKAAKPLQEKFHKWLIERFIDDHNKEQYKKLLETFPFFDFDGTWKSIKNINSTSNYILTTDRIEPIKTILSKLDYTCSTTLFNATHPLKKYIDGQVETSIFDDIAARLPNVILYPQEKLKLFNTLKEFEGIGEKHLGEIVLFNNMNNKPTPLCTMLAHRENGEVWLKPYIMSKAENFLELKSYLISDENAFSKIIWTHRKDILDHHLSIKEFFERYKWSDNAYTRMLIDEYKDRQEEILDIVEIADKETRKHFLNKVEPIKLRDNQRYKKDSFVFRVLQLAATDDEMANTLANKIFYQDQDQCITTFSVKDEVVCKYKENDIEKKVVFSLAQLLPKYQNKSDVIAKIKTLFESPKNLDKFFNAKEKPIDEIYKELNTLLDIPHKMYNPWRVGMGNAYQYLFSVYRRKQSWHDLYGLQINLSEESVEFINNMMNFLYENKISIASSPFTYHIKNYFAYKYFNNDFILDEERLLSSIEKWADDDKKKKYLENNGVQNSETKSIRFRQLFKENKPIDFLNELININKDDILKHILKFLAFSNHLQRPFTGEKQIEILKQISKKANLKNLCNKIDEEKLKKQSKQWDSESYKEWAQMHPLKIYLHPQPMPQYLYYNMDYMDIREMTKNGMQMVNTTNTESLVEYNEKDYYYNSQDKILYINSSVEQMENILYEIATQKQINFTIEDWRVLCWEGKTTILKDELEQKDKEIESMKLRIQELEKQLEGKSGLFQAKGLGRGENGHLLFDNPITTPDLSKEQQIVAHKEAEEVVKRTLEEAKYDCSNWILQKDNGDEGKEIKKWQSVNQIEQLVKTPEGDPINLVVKSAKGGYLYLSATDFEFLTSNSNNLLMVWDGQRAHSVTGEQIFNKDSNVNLIFDTKYTPNHYYVALSKVFQFVKRTTFAVKNPAYDVYETIQSFGMDSKTEGVQELFDDEDL